MIEVDWLGLEVIRVDVLGAIDDWVVQHSGHSSRLKVMAGGCFGDERLCFTD